MGKPGCPVSFQTLLSLPPHAVCIGIPNLLHECEESTLMSSCLHSKDLVTHLPRSSLSQFIIFLKMLIINLLILLLKSALFFSARSSLHQSWANCRDKRLSRDELAWTLLTFSVPATRLFKSKPSAAESLEVEGEGESLWAPLHRPASLRNSGSWVQKYLC